MVSVTKNPHRLRRDKNGRTTGIRRSAEGLDPVVEEETGEARIEGESKDHCKIVSGRRGGGRLGMV